MKVLLLTSEDYTITYSELYVGLHKRIGSMDTRRLGVERFHLRNYFTDHINLSKYDRIVIHIEFGALQPQLRFLKQIDNLIFYDTSAYFSRKNKHLDVNHHLSFFKKMPWSRVIVSNYQAMTLFQKEGLDAWCVPKGYNSQRYKDKGLSRRIPLMLVKNTSDAHTLEYQRFENELIKRYPKLQVENDIIEASLSKLSRTLICINADFNRGEYSSKIFQAMISGCLVMSFNQGNEENFFHALKDMENIVLFDDIDSLVTKIGILKKKPKLIEKIAKNGQRLAYEQHQDIYLGNKLADYVLPSLRNRDDYRIGISAFGLRI